MVQLSSRSGATRRGRPAAAVVVSLTVAIGAFTFFAAPSAAINGRPTTPTTAPLGIIPIPTSTTPPRTTVPRPTTTQAPTTEAPTTTAAPETTAAPQPPETTQPPVAPPTNPQIPVTAIPDADAEPFELPCEPDALDDYYTATKGEHLEVPAGAGIGVNDVICSGASYTIDNLTDPANGLVEKTPNEYGAFAYTPDPGFTGSDSFTYSLLADDIEVDTATVHIKVTDDCSVVAFKDTYVTPFDTPVSEAAPGFVANDIVECQPYVVIVMSDPINGTLTDNGDGGFDYTPNSGFIGLDKFSYEIHDEVQQILANSVVTIVVEAPPCVANDDAYSTPVDMTLTVGAPGVLSNDVVCPEFFSIGISQAPANGIAILNFDGGFEYVPNAGYVGPDIFTYNIVKLDLPFNTVADTATVTIDVQPACDVSLVDDSYETAVDTDLYVGPPGPGLNDSLCDPVAELQVVTNPTNGAVTLLGSGDMTYTPNPGFVGTDTFTYTIAVAPEQFGLRGLRHPAGSPEPLATVTINVTETPSPTTTTPATTTTVPTDPTSTTTPGTPTTTPGGGTLPPTGFLPATR